MSKTTVKTEEELKHAIEKEIEEIIIDNPDLASKLKLVGTLQKCSPYAVGLALTAIAAFASTPITGPIGPVAGTLAFGGAAMATGMTVTALSAIAILAAVIGLATFFAIYKGYNIIEFRLSAGLITTALRLKKDK